MAHPGELPRPMMRLAARLPPDQAFGTVGEVRLKNVLGKIDSSWRGLQGRRSFHFLQRIM